MNSSPINLLLQVSKIPSLKSYPFSQVWWLTSLISTLWEAKMGGSWGQEFKTSLARWWNPVSTKNIKTSQAWWQETVITATWEAEAEDSLEPGWQRLQLAKIEPLYFSLGNRMRLSQKKKKKVKVLWLCKFLVLSNFVLNERKVTYLAFFRSNFWDSG